MCRLLRCTAKRTARCAEMRSRVWRERRMRWSFLLCMACSLLLLRFLDHHALAGVADALALVGLGRTQRAHLGGDLAHDLAIRALDDDLRLRGRLDLHAGRHVLRDRMRIADLQVELGALGLGAKAHADEREALLEALRDAA